MSVIVRFKYAKGYLERAKEFNQDPPAFLIKLHYNKANKVRIKQMKGQSLASIEVNSDHILIHKGKQMDRSITKGIREIDTNRAKLNYIILQYEQI